MTTYDIRNTGYRHTPDGGRTALDRSYDVSGVDTDIVPSIRPSARDLTGVETTILPSLELSIKQIAEQDTLRLPAVTLPDQQPNVSLNSTGAGIKAAWSSLLQIAGKLFGYLTAVLVLSATTRLLDTARYGDYTIAVVYLSFFGVIADVGVGVIGVREAARYPNQVREIFAAIFSMKMVTSILSYSIAGLIIVALPYGIEVKLATLLLVPSLIFASIGSVYDVLFQSRLDMRVPTMADASFKVVSFLGTGGLLFFSTRIRLSQVLIYYLVVGLLALANMVGFGMRMVGAGRELRGFLRLNFDRTIWAYMLRIAAPMGVIAILGQIHYKVDAIILSLMQAPHDVAIYGVAYKIVDLLLSVFSVLGAMAFPILSSFPDVRSREIALSARRVVDLSISLVLPVIVGVIATAPEITGIIGGGRYPEATLPLQILALSLLFSFLNMVYDYVIIAGNRQSNLIWVVSVSIAANVGLNLWAIPHYSYLGSSVVTVITEGLTMLGAMFVANRFLRMKPSVLPTIKTFVATGIMTMTILGMQHSLPASYPIVHLCVLTAAGSMSYIACMLLMRGFDPFVVNLLQRFVKVGRKFG